MPSIRSKLSFPYCLPGISPKKSKKAMTSSTKTSQATKTAHYEADEVIQGRREYFYTCEDLDKIVPKEWVEETSPVLVSFEDSDIKNDKQKLKNTSKHDPKKLPFNEPAEENIFEFETEFFEGRGLLRFKDCPNYSKSYFKGRKRRQQWIFQGTFKKELVVGDICSGYELKVPAKNLPGKFIVKPILGLLRKLAPTMKENVFGEKPFVYNPLLQTIQTLDVSLTGQEPNLTTHELLENNYLFFLSNSSEEMKIKKGKSAKERKKYFASTSNGKNYKFVPGYVYTFEFYEDKVDVATFKFILPFLSVDLRKHMGNEPIPIMAKIVNEESVYNGEYVFKLNIYHKLQLESVAKEEEKEKELEEIKESRVVVS